MEAQFEASNQYHQAQDKSFVKEVMELRKELKKQVEEEFGVDDEEKMRMLDQKSAT